MDMATIPLTTVGENRTREKKMKNTWNKWKTSWKKNKEPWTITWQSLHLDWFHGTNHSKNPQHIVTLTSHSCQNCAHDFQIVVQEQDDDRHESRDAKENGSNDRESTNSLKWAAVTKGHAKRVAIDGDITAAGDDGIRANLIEWFNGDGWIRWRSSKVKQTQQT